MTRMLDRKKVLTARRVVGEMLADRGLDVEWATTEVDDDDGPDQEFLDSLGGSAGAHFKVTWSMVLSADTVKATVADLGSDPDLGHVLMMVGSETNAAKEKVLTYNRVNPEHKIEVWRWDACQFNVVRHVLVPRHTLAPQEELELVCRVHHLKPEEFPVLLSSDPVCRWYDFPVGSLVKIMRSDESVSYRIVRRPAS